MFHRDEPKNINDMFALSINEIQKTEFYDTLFDVDTSAVVDGKETFDNKLFYRYQATNYSFLEYIFKIYPFEKEDHIMDVGFGKGRVLFMASYLGCNKISGCEICEEYFRITKRNVDKYLCQTKSKTIFTLLHEDAQKVKIDRTVNKLFFFNPFHLKVYIKFFGHLMELLKQVQRKTTIFLFSPLPSTFLYLDKTTEFSLIEKIDINDNHALFAVYQN
ncbi:MAG: hypothetical protein LBQ68_09445 [Clostridiales bacterium]|jgi:hypothetical protein|nr:hypothetical protein [Clostridiales bacterium]